MILLPILAPLVPCLGPIRRSAVGFAVGFTGGLHRYSLGGMSAFACMVSTIVEGLIGGLVHRYFMKRGEINKIFNPMIASCVTFIAEIIQMLIILLLAKPFDEALELVKISLHLWSSQIRLAQLCLFVFLLDRRAIVENTQLHSLLRR